MTHRHFSRALVAMLLAASASAWAGVTAQPRPGAPVLGTDDCQHLLAQFDVAWESHRASKRADAAHRVRDLGDAACREGRYGDGVHQLKRALHDLGMKPVRRASAALPR
jgi:hypothetical protein